MNIFVEESYEAMSKAAADAVIEVMQRSASPLLCVASGDSPKGLYSELVQRVKARTLDVSSWHFVGLDEWVGLNGSDEGSCRYLLDKELFQPLHIPAERISFFDGRAHDLEAECERVIQYIRAHDGLDAAVVGLGMNGHVGLNEPGTPPALHAHVSTLAAVTKEVGQKYFTRQQELSEGITLGIADLLAAQRLLLLVGGGKKASIVRQVVEEPESENIPGSLLRRHSDFHLYLDREAASLLKSPHGTN